MKPIKDRLTEAADYLDAMAEVAEYKPGRFFVDVAGPVASTSWLGPTHDVLTATWPQAALVGRIGTPVMARLLAALMRIEAQTLAGDELHDRDCTPANCPAMAAAVVADHVLKEKEKAT